MSLLTSILPSFNHPSSAAPAGAEETPPARQPAYVVAETADDFTLTVDLPGVAKEGLEVTAEEGVVTVTARRSWQKPDGWSALHRESPEAGYSLSLAYPEAVDPDKIAAVLTDGVLRVTLPKAETRKPRTIPVN